MEKILEKAIEFFNSEYEETESYIKGKVFSPTEKIIEDSIQRCLGVAFFVQALDVSYKDIEPHYQEIRTKLKSLLGE